MLFCRVSKDSEYVTDFAFSLEHVDGADVIAYGHRFVFENLVVVFVNVCGEASGGFDLKAACHFSA